MDVQQYELPQPLYGTVNVYRVGNTLIDTGHLTTHEAFLEALGNDLPAIEQVVLTHPHSDHVGGSQTIPQLADLPHTVFAGMPVILHNFNSYLGNVHDRLRERGGGLEDHLDVLFEAYFPQGAYQESAINIERVVYPGDTIELGGYECEVIHTPGHAARHMALYHEPSKTLLSADILSQSGYFTLGPLSSDLEAYKNSLQKLRGYELQRIFPGHGSLIETPTARITDAIEQTRQAEEAILEAVTQSDGRITTQDLAREAFDAKPESVPFLSFVVTEYLEALENAGKLELEITAEGVYASSKNGKQ